VTDETAWILQAQNGSDEAFTQLVETYQNPVYNLCYRMLGEPEAAEDAAQETFFKAYRNLARYDINRSFATWLLSIAAHHCIDRLRRKKYIAFSIDDDENHAELPDSNAPDPEHETVRREVQAQMQTLLKSLDATDRAAVVLRYWNDCSEVEIAQALSLTVPAVKSRLHRARRALAKLWEEETTHSQVERRPYESPAF
jgi:RNA polymerase sigma-70 factor (ECF subfamily)